MDKAWGLHISSFDPPYAYPCASQTQKKDFTCDTLAPPLPRSIP